MKRSILLTIGVAAVLVGTVALGTTYVIAQRIEREGADDAAWRLASQVVDELKAGSTTTVDALPRVDLSTSLVPFVIVFDATDAAVAGTGFLHGELGTVPSGVLDTAREGGSNHVSWQPERGLRFATVEVAIGHWVILAGQSLQPSEARTDSMGLLVLAAWLSLVILVAAGVILGWIFAPDRPAATEALINR